MKTVTSVSGGKSSAYIAANYPSDFLVFALVCIEDRNCTPKDKKLVQMVSDRIGREFIATAEDDIILLTMLDLEQYLGQRIDWVVGPTFDHIIQDKRNGVLPSSYRRYCTAFMKMEPMFDWWLENIGEVVEMQIGFRANEMRRAENHKKKCNEDGFLVQPHVVGKWPSGRNKWAKTAWQKPVFPLIGNGIFGDEIKSFWQNKPVRFAEYNNCVGCFHRHPILLRQMFDKHPDKMEWFAKQERNRTYPNDFFMISRGISYDEIAKHKPQIELGFDDFSECDSGYCGL